MQVHITPPGFYLDNVDSIVTFGVWLTLAGTATIEISIDGIDWASIEGSSITCNTYGIQTFVDGQSTLLYRIAADQEVIKALILV